MALIMIADDDLVLVETVQAYLESRGHQVVSVNDGVNASIKAQEWRPHLIVMDIQMPGAYGTTAFESLKMAGVTERTPILFLTGLALDKAAQIVPTGPRTRLLGKPVDFDQLEAVITELLRPASPPAP